MKPVFDLAIVGAGPIGAMAALLAAKTELKVVLLDAAPQPSAHCPDGPYDLRVVALAPGSQALLQRLGAWPEELQARAQAYTAMDVWDGSGPGRIAFSAGELGLPALGHILEVPVLQWALDQAVAHAGENGQLTRLQSAEYRHHHWVDEGVELVCSSGETVTARAVLGADGRASRVRKRAGIDVELREYHQQGLVAVLEPIDPHGNVARQVFTDIGPLGLLPLANGQVSIVWSVPDAELATLLADKPEVFCRKLAQASGQNGFKLISSRAAFPLILQHATRYSEEAIAVLGDAAHAVHPLAGLGMNLGIEDVIALFDGLNVRALRQAPAAVLEQFGRQRRRAVLPALAVLEAIHTLFGSRQAEVVRLRDFGLNTVDRQQRIKQEFMRYALGSVPAMDGEGQRKAV